VLDMEMRVFGTWVSHGEVAFYRPSVLPEIVTGRDLPTSGPFG